MERPRVRGSELRSEGGALAAASKERIFARSPLGRLDGPSRSALIELGSLERLARRHRIVQQGEPPRHLVLLGTGRVKIERVTEGRVFPIGHRGPGEIVGETALAGSPAATESATVLDEGEAVLLPLAGLQRRIATDPVLRGAVAAALVQRQLETEARLASLLLRSVEARLLEFLGAAARRWGQPHSSGELVSAPFTHADIALLIGSTRETVTLLLGKMKRAGLIGFERRRVVIRDGAMLAARPAAT
jgi:CRP/FNR family transcriptional regulator, cyclic AMP receptor protein